MQKLWAPASCNTWIGLFEMEPKLWESARAKEAHVRLNPWQILEEEIDTQGLSAYICMRSQAVSERIIWFPLKFHLLETSFTNVLVQKSLGNAGKLLDRFIHHKFLNTVRFVGKGTLSLLIHSHAELSGSRGGADPSCWPRTGHITSRQCDLFRVPLHQNTSRESLLALLDFSHPCILISLYKLMTRSQIIHTGRSFPNTWKKW